MIYLDHNATTPLAPEVRAAMLPFMESEFGNPSSGYALGRRAKEAVERARTQVAALLNAEPDEVIFTSGGTESNNHVIKGVADHFAGNRRHMITTKIEHPAVLEPMIHLMTARGWDVTFLPVDGDGQVDPSDVSRSITPATVLISVMHSNNETGVLQPVDEIAEMARKAGVLFHTDAAQSMGKVPVDVKASGVDFLSIAGHKLYAPKGVGALFIRKGAPLDPFMHGAGQESGQRAGTENVIHDVALGEACRLARENSRNYVETMRSTRDLLARLLKESIPGLVVFGESHERLPNTLFAAFPGVSGADMLAGAPYVYASTGAACHDTSVRLSHVLSAMNVDENTGKGAVRLTTGRSSTPELIAAAAEALVRSWRSLTK